MTDYDDIDRIAGHVTRMQSFYVMAKYQYLQDEGAKNTSMNDFMEFLIWQLHNMVEDLFEPFKPKKETQSANAGKEIKYGE